MPYGNGSTNHFGTTGDDVLTGDRGTDYFMGGPGNDTLTGGRGQDVFWGSSNGFDFDLITDFQAGHSHDMLVFDGYGEWTAAGADNYLPHAPLFDGQVLTTEFGHALTVADAGSGVTLTWDTGAGFLVAGVEPGDLYGDWLVSYSGSYGFAW